MFTVLSLELNALFIMLTMLCRLLIRVIGGLGPSWHWMKMSFHELETFGACFRAYCKSHVLYAEVLCTPCDLQACGSECRAFMKVLTHPPTLGGLLPLDVHGPSFLLQWSCDMQWLSQACTHCLSLRLAVDSVPSPVCEKQPCASSLCGALQSHVDLKLFHQTFWYIFRMPK